MAAAIFILFFTIVSVPFAKRFRLPLEIFLVMGSCLISLISDMPKVQIPPDMVFFLFLPPILFYAAYFTSWQDFKYNARAIHLLAFGLTLFTATLVAIAAKFLLPNFSWAESFLLGAIVSPTDASSATTIIKKLGAPRQLLTLLAGESLINDAAALTLFSFSLAVMVTGNFSLPNAIGAFVIIAVGGALVGWIIGIVAVRFLKLLHDSEAEIAFTFVIAFTNYLIAESLHVSGVIATVICGIYFGYNLPDYMSSQSHLKARASWATLVFIINAFIFTFIGFELPQILSSVKAYTVPHLLMYGGIISGLLILARIVWLLPGMIKPRLYCKGIKPEDPIPAWQKLFILGWSGMRGIVSLAAALSIPFTLAPNLQFPNRDLILFLTYFVIVIMLIIPTFLLPLLLKIFKLQESNDLYKEKAYARLQALEGVIDRLDSLTKKEHIPVELFNEYKNQINRRVKIIKTQLEDVPYSTIISEYYVLKRLAITAALAEKETLIQLRKAGIIHDEVFHDLLQEVDIEEVRGRSIRL
jgi:monovalent cation/hydrogen antiporter